MSLWESRETNSSVSLQQLFDNPEKPVFSKSDLDIESLIFAACRGGWPASLKRAFCDPSIAAALLGMSPESMKTDLKTFGFIFEQLCIRDLRVYSQYLGGEISYYHDRYGLEADIVLHLADGRYALIECKLGGKEIEVGAAHLVEIKNLIIEHNKTEKQMPIRVPDLLIVITGGEYGVTRPDGVKVIPIGSLCP